jgi:hypothetical protein
MKSILLFIAASAITIAVSGQQDDKSKRPSPPAKVSETTKDGVTITIDYSQPSVKGRTIGKDLEPLPGKVWRTGANEATVFEVNKDVKVEGHALPAGKYGLFTIADGKDWTIILNKTWKQWGAFTYKEADDALRFKVKADKAKDFAEMMKFDIDKKGEVTLRWGNEKVDFKVK